MGYEVNVYVNGVMLDKADYIINGERVTFMHRPRSGDRVEFSGVSQNPFKYTKTADGFTDVFVVNQIWQDTIAHNSLMNQAWNHREHPMIKDALERLEAAIALVKE